MAGHYETEMYKPVKELFESMSYTVNAEVKDCDIAAYRDDGELIIIEMKNSFNLKLLYQGIERQRITKAVYLAINRPRGMNTADGRNMRRIVRRLGLGLIFVALDGGLAAAEIIIEPEAEKSAARKSTARRRAVTDEIAGRKFSTNEGGSSGVKLNTAYRERCIRIACIIEQRGEQSARALVSAYGCERDAYNIISKCPYGWFMRVGKGIYGLAEAGHEFLDGDEFRAQVEYYRGLYRV